MKMVISKLFFTMVFWIEIARYTVDADNLLEGKKDISQHKYQMIPVSKDLQPIKCHRLQFKKKIQL